MNTFQLSCFLAVANTLNFAKAAEQMSISQPAITHQIKSLETELNVKLFNRSTRLVEITPEGQAFRADAQSMVAIAEQAKLRFSNPSEKPVKKLSIGCSSHYELSLLSDSLYELSAIFPNLRPRLVIVPHEQLYSLLDNGSADVIFDFYDSAKDLSKLTFRELFKSPICCVCREGHALENAECVSMEDLKTEPLVFCNPINLIPEVASLQWKLAENRQPMEMHFCDSAASSIILACAGFGLAFLPERLVPSGHYLSKVPLADAPELTFGAFYKPYPGDEVLRKLIQIAKQQFCHLS